MVRYTVVRLLLMVLTIFFIMTLVFFIMRVLPGDAAYVILGAEATPEAYEEVRKELGLNQPLIMQYLNFLGQFAAGDLGRSLKNGIPVIQLIKRAMPYTIDLTLASFIIGIAIGIPLGILAALRRNSFFDFITRVVTLTGISIPTFLLGILLLFLFAYRFTLFPLIGGGELGNMAERLHHLVLPAFSLGLVFAALVMRMTRSCMLEVIREDYIRTAKAKGLSRPAVIYKHALKNALIPVVTIIGNYIGRLLGGTVLIEIVFTRPGMGKLLVDGIMGRDYPLVQGTIIYFAFWIVLANLAVDLLYSFINPRISYK